MIVNIDNFDKEKISFSNVESSIIPNTDIHLKKIKILYDNDSFFMLSPDNLISFGLDEKLSVQNKNLTGYQMSVLLWSKETIPIRTEEEKFIRVLNDITEKIRTHLLSIQKEINRSDLLFEEEVQKLNTIYYKKEKGKIIPNKSPILFLRCFYDKQKEKIETIFIDEEDQKEVNPFMCFHQKINTKLMIKIDSIYMNREKITIQLKLSKCMFRKIQKKAFHSILCPSTKINSKLQDCNVNLNVNVN